jgi:hypothetical protein
VRRTAIREVSIEILKSDGTPIGSIIGLGFSGGASPPGAPLARTGGSWAIVGGTGAFLGARGEFGGAQARGSAVGRDTSRRRRRADLVIVNFCWTRPQTCQPVGLRDAIGD